MMLDPYVNYVIQTTLNHSKEDMDRESWLLQGPYFSRATQVCWNSPSLTRSHQNFEQQEASEGAKRGQNAFWSSTPALQSHISFTSSTPS